MRVAVSDGRGGLGGRGLPGGDPVDAGAIERPLEVRFEAAVVADEQPRAAGGPAPGQAKQGRSMVSNLPDSVAWVNGAPIARRTANSES